MNFSPATSVGANMRSVLLLSILLSACAPKADELADAGLEGQPCVRPAGAGAFACDGQRKATLFCYDADDGGQVWRRRDLCEYHSQRYACTEGCPEVMGCNVTGVCNSHPLPRCDAEDGCPDGWYCGDGTSCWQDGYCGAAPDGGAETSCFYSDGGFHY